MPEILIHVVTRRRQLTSRDTRTILEQVLIQSLDLCTKGIHPFFRVLLYINFECLSHLLGQRPLRDISVTAAVYIT